MIKKKAALITGSGEGIGRALAIECAKYGYTTILASLPNEALEKTKNHIIEHYSVDVYAIGLNFLDENACETLVQNIHDLNLSIDLLINNVGLGDGGPFQEKPYGYYQVMLKLNIDVATHLTYLLFDDLKKSNSANIINIASLAGVSPIPYKAVYSASKAYILYLSRCLQVEFKKYNIGVTAVCPSAVVTNDDVKERIKNTGRFGPMTAITPEKLAEVALRKGLKNQFKIVPGFFGKIFNLFLTFTPSFIRFKLIGLSFK